MLEGQVFLLIGQQVPVLVEGLAAYEASTIVLASVVSLGVVLLLRPLWLLLTQMLPQSLHTRLGGTKSHDDTGGENPEARRMHAAGRLTGKELVVFSGAGPRSVISLAAIFTLPR